MRRVRGDSTRRVTLFRVVSIVVPLAVVVVIFHSARINQVVCLVDTAVCKSEYQEFLHNALVGKSSLLIDATNVERELREAFPELVNADVKVLFPATVTATLMQATWLAQDLSASPSAYMVVTSAGVVLETETDPGLLTVTTPAGWWQPGQASFPKEAVDWLAVLKPLQSEIVEVDISKPWEITVVARGGQRWKGNLFDNPVQSLREIEYIRTHYPGTPPIIDVRFARPVLSETTSPVD